VIARLRKEQGIPYRQALDSLMLLKRETMKGIYWPSSVYYRYDWYRDDLATTLQAYALIKGDSVYGHYTDAIARYILLRRQSGYYSSTASSGLVLTTLLPDMLAEKMPSEKQHTYVNISGSIRDSVTSFPQRYAIRDAKPQFHFEKKGFGPVYVSVVYDYFNTKPQIRDTDFAVRSYFLDRHQDTVRTLRAGERITLRTVIQVNKDAEYVMVNVPIPAGCIQVDKLGYHHYSEAARESFKDQTCIFFNQLQQGTHTVDLTLEARYKGSYVLSPARAGMMYYPEEYGNTKVDRIRID
jgi:alpha-2-macroglobulin